MVILGELREITARLDREGIDYALCGGLAMAVYALPQGLVLLKSVRGSGTDEYDIAHLRRIADED